MPLARKYSPEGIAASVLFLILIVVVLIQVFGRLDIFTGPVWTEELARWLWVWMAFLGIGEVERTDSQLRMGFLADRLRHARRRILNTVVDGVYLAIMGHLCWIGYKTVLRTWNNEAVTLPVSDAVLYAAFFVASFFILLRIVARIRSRFGPQLDQSDPEASS